MSYIIPLRTRRRHSFSYCFLLLAQGLQEYSKIAILSNLFTIAYIAKLIYHLMADSRLWTFMEYVTPGGRGVVSQWVAKDIEMEAENEFHAILLQLQNTSRDLWVRPDYAPFDPEIGEIRFKAAKVQHRVFGFFLIESQEYVMLMGSQKKGRIYTPKDAVETA